jgi:hypothetical protein
MPSPRLPLSESAAFTGWRALSPFDMDPLACRHAALSTPSTSGPCSTEESVAATQPFGSAPLDAPMGFGSNTFCRCCRAFRAAQTFPCWTFRLAVPNPLRRPRPEKSEEGKESRPCLAPAPCSPSSRRTPARSDGRFQPEGWCAPCRSLFPEGRNEPVAFGSDAFPKDASRPHATSGPERYSGMPVDPPRGENPPRRSKHPKAFGADESRALPEGRPCDPARAPKSGTGGSSSLPSLLPRSPAYMRKGRSPHALDHPKVIRRMRTARASRLEDAASNPRAGPPKESIAQESRAPPGGGRLPTRGSGDLQQAGGPVSGQTVIFFTGQPGRDPKIEVLSPTRKPKSRRRSAGGAVGAAHPTRRW